MSEVNNTHIVQKGECAWNVAKKNLEVKNQNGKVSNAEVIKEMQRLAKLNGCDSVDDFNTKYFSKIGSEFICDKAVKNSSSTSKKLSQGNPVPKDTVDSTKVKKNETSVSKDTATVNTKKNTKAVTGYNTGSSRQLTAKEKEIQTINQLPTDTDRIIEYNKKNYDGKYYAIVDKKSCKLKIYDKNGNVVKTLTVGVGKKVGDNLGTFYLERAEKTVDAYKAEQGRYTTPGEFVLDELGEKTPVSEHTKKDYSSKTDGKLKVMHLKGDNKGERSGQQAIHMIPNSNPERIPQIDSATTADNRMSYGCVNLKESDYDILAKYLGEGDKVFILPEEKGNKLLLEKQKDGSYKFAQQYHKDQKRGVSAEQASKVNYDVRPQRDPKYIAEQKQKKAEQEKQLAEQKAKEEAKKFCWYKPTTWFS